MRLFLAVIATGILAIVPVQSEKPGVLNTCGDHVGPAKGSSTKVKTARNRDQDDLQQQKYVHRSIAAENLEDELLTRRYAPYKQETLRAGPSTGSNLFRRRAYESRRDFGGTSRRAMDKPPSVIVKDDHPDEEHPDIDPRASYSSGVDNDVQRASASDDLIIERALNMGENSDGRASTSKAEESAAVDFSDPAIRERRKKGKRRPHHRPRPRPNPEPELRAFDDDGEVQQLEVDPRASFSSEVDGNVQGGSGIENLAMERSSNLNEKSEIQNVGSEKPETGKKPTSRRSDMESSATTDIEDPAIRERRKKGKRRPHHRPRPKPRPWPRPVPNWRGFDDDGDAQQLEVDPRASFSSEDDSNVQGGSGIESLAMERSSNANEKSEIQNVGSEKPETGKKPTSRRSDMESSATTDIEDPAIRERRKKGKRRPHHRPRPRPRPEQESRAFDDDDNAQQLEVDPRASFSSEVDDGVRDGSAIEAVERSLDANGISEVGFTGSDKSEIDSLVEDSRKKWRLPRPKFSRPGLRPRPRPQPMPRPRPRPGPGRKPRRGRKPSRRPRPRPRPRPHEGDSHTYVNVVLDGLGNAAQATPDFMQNPNVGGDMYENYDNDGDYPEENISGDGGFPPEEELHQLDGLGLRVVPLGQQPTTRDGISLERRSNNEKQNNVRYSDEDQDSMAKIVQRILGVDGSHSRRYGSRDLQSSMSRRSRPNSETLYWA